MSAVMGAALFVLGAIMIGVGLAVLGFGLYGLLFLDDAGVPPR